ncbi:MAG: hypothetical protein JW830_03160 [Bacteroidales bacterium]|nr:hypothetical protein [Bacteroidales bacterium]
MTFLFTALFSALLQFHPLHVSFTSIDIHKEKGEAALSFKFYTEDFSLLFYHLYEKDIRPEMDRELTGDQVKIFDGYLKRAFILVSGQDTADLSYTRKDQNEEYIWLYYTISTLADLNKPVYLTNILMLDLYEDQTNLVIVTNGKNEKGYTFDYRNRREEIDIGQD